MSSDLNPYASPQHPSSRTQGSNVPKALFFLINFSVACLLCLMCVFMIAGTLLWDVTPFAFLGPIFLIVPTAWVAAAEWRLFVTDQVSLQRTLGATCGAGGAFAVFGFVSNVYEAVMDGGPFHPQFWLIFGTISCVIAAYGFLCCWYRVRGT